MNRGMLRRAARIPGPIKVFLAIDLLFGLVYLLAEGLSATRFDWAWDLNLEKSLPTWYSSVQLALVGLLLLGLLLARSRRWVDAAILLAAGGAFLFLSVDELVGMHERFAERVEARYGSREESGLNRSGPWVLFVGPAFLAGCAAAFYAARNHLRRYPHAATLFIVGALVFAASFAGLELLGNFAGRDVHRLVLVPAEETGEMLAGTLFLWGAYALVRSSGFVLLAGVEGEDAPTAVRPTGPRPPPPSGSRPHGP